MGKWTTIAEAAIELLSKRKGGALPDTTLDSVPPKALPIDEASRTLLDKVRKEGGGSEGISAIFEETGDPLNSIADIYNLDTVRPSDVANVRGELGRITRESLSVLPDTITVYRGGNIRGELVPVTTRRDTARRFAKQSGEPLLEFQIPKSAVVADVKGILGSNASFLEDELLVRPSALRLPTDEASRMARAQEFPVESYHGTRSEFGDFGGRGFGDHFGTPEQANMRLKNTRRERGDEGAERVLPVRLNIRNPLEMEDVGEWGSPAKVAEGLKKTPVGAKNSQALDEIIEEAEGLRPQFEDNDYFLASPEAEDLLDEMRRMVEAEGHDGIKYSNQVENTYGDRADLTPEAKKIKSELEADLRKIQKTISDRDPAPPLGSDVATLQRWLDRPKIEPTTAEAAELERVNKALQYSNFETGDPNSYIVFDPSNVRSRFAQFDPAKKDSADILAGLGVVGAGAALSQQDGFDYGALSNVVEESNVQSSN